MQIANWNNRCPGGNSNGIFVNRAIAIRNGAANKNLIPVAKTGGIVSATILIANHVVPQVNATDANKTDIIILYIAYSLRIFKCVLFFNMIIKVQILQDLTRTGLRTSGKQMQL